MNKHLSNFLLILIIVAGLSLLLYPSFSDYWNSQHQSRAIATYSDSVSQLDTGIYRQMLAEATGYNRMLPYKPNRYMMTDEEKLEYNSLLDVTGTGIMGYIEIPNLDCMLPIYHGTDEAVLQIAIGHIEGTSLPVGGVGTHSVLSGHRGLPSAKLFTNLDKMVEGDVFLLHILDDVLTYQVDQILVVEPHIVEPLDIDPTRDLCTLVTCTPYGINSHRLLVRGTRIETVEEEAPVYVHSEAMRVEWKIVAACIGIPLAIVYMFGSLIFGGGKKKK